MKKEILKKILSCCAAVLAIAFVLIIAGGCDTVQAADPKPVSIGKIDYDELR